MIGQLLPLAVGVAVNPIPIIAVIVILLSPTALRAGSTFVVTWLVALFALAGVATVVANQTSLYGSGYSSPAARWIKGLVGVLLLVLAVRKWLGRPRGGEPASAPRWLEALATASVGRSAALGAGLAAGNPKNIALTLAAAAAIVETGLPPGAEVAWLVAFVVVASIGVAVPVVAFAMLGDRGPEVLGRWGTWLTRHNAVVLATVLAVIAVVLLVGAIRG